MPTTFNVISIGQLADIDQVEGDYLADNAAALEGMTFGGLGDALTDNFVSLSSAGSPGSFYNQNGMPNEQFSIDGGPAQTFDATAVFNATVTFVDGSTGTYSAVVFQDTNGNTYLAPEFSDNADQALLESGAIRSISLDSLLGDRASGLTASREEWDFVTCFVRGTKIEAAKGYVPIETLTVGDLVQTVDSGLQPVRWIGRRRMPAYGAFAPILFRAGALGNTEDLRVSPQHRMLLTGWRAEMLFGAPEVLVAAKHLINDQTILCDPGGEVTYFHILFDQHALIFAAGIVTESFHPGTAAWDILSCEAREEIMTLFPALKSHDPTAYGPVVRPVIKSYEARAMPR